MHSATLVVPFAESSLTRFPRCSQDCRTLHLEIRHQFLDIRLAKFKNVAALQVGRQDERPVADAHQPADDNADRFEHAPHFAVTSLEERYAVPAVGALAAGFFESGELGDAVVEFDAGQQLLFRTFRQLAEKTETAVLT